MSRRSPCVTLWRDASLPCQDSVFQLQYAPGLFGQFRIVSDDDQARGHVAIEFEHQVEYLSRGAAIEIPGGFIREHAGGAGDQRPGDGGALTLAPPRVRQGYG